MAKKDRKLEWKIGSVIIIALFALLIGFIAWFFYVGSPKEIVSVADQFSPEPDWTLTQEHIQPPSNSCINTVCPQVIRVWSLPKKLDREQLEEVAKVGANKLIVSQDCFEKSRNGRIIELCDASGAIKDYELTLSYSGNGHDDNSPKLVLIVERKR